MKRMTTVAATVTAAAIACAGLTVPASADSPATVSAAAQDRGRLVSWKHLRTLSAKAAKKRLASDHFDTGKIRYGVDMYRLVYRTVDARQRPTTASGLLVVPRTKTRKLRTVSYTHGTEIFRGDAPSTAKDVWGSAPAITFGSAGFAAVAPDYLGLGVGPGLHPWMDIPSETTASADMLRAARAFVPRTGHTLQPKVLVTGFSQGASAALGLGRALQGGGVPGFRLGALAPISGAYDFSGAELPALLGGKLNPVASTVYAAYTFVAFNRLHHIYDSPREVFEKKYADKVEKVFDGNHTGPQMIKTLPQSIDALLTKRGLELLGHPTGGLAAALKGPDGVCTTWTPRVPVRLYKSDVDEQATAVNTAHCATALRARGVTVKVVDVGRIGHLDTNRRGTAATVRWFLSAR